MPRFARASYLMLLAVLATGCPGPTVKPGDISFREFIVPCPRAQVFDDALRFAQSSNLAVSVLEKSSGLIKFERATLDPIEMDAFCEFPLRDPKTGAAFSTFYEWITWWGEGTEEAKVFLNILMSERGSKQTAVNVRGNWSVIMTNNAHSEPPRAYVLNSTGVLESMLRDHLVSACDGRTSTNTIERIREFSRKYEELRARYDDGSLKEADYQRQRDQLLNEFHRGITGDS